eukprot:gene13722-biopygen3986
MGEIFLNTQYDKKETLIWARNLTGYLPPGTCGSGTCAGHQKPAIEHDALRSRSVPQRRVLRQEDDAFVHRAAHRVADQDHPRLGT